MGNASLLSPKVGTGMQSPLNTMNQTRDTFNSLTPTGLKGKLASLEDFISMQNEELAAQRMQEEVKRHFAHQKAENSRLQQQITTLKGEKTSLQQQILGLQRRIQEIEEQIGSD